MDDVEIIALKGALKVASDRSEYSAVLVALGVFIELVALFVFSKEMPRSEKYVMIGATALIVLGCIGEFKYGSRVSSDAQQLQNASDKQIASAVNAAATLGVRLDNLNQFVEDKSREINATTENLKRDTDELNKARKVAIKTTQELRKTIDDTRNEQKELEEANSPRILEQGSVIKAMEPYKNIPVYIMTDSVFGDPEFAEYLSAAISNGSGNTHILPSDGKSIPMGIFIEYATDVNNFGAPLSNKARQSAIALCRALAEQDLDVSIMNGFSWYPKIPQNGILVRVGKKWNLFFVEKMIKKRWIMLPDTSLKSDLLDKLKEKYSYCE